ncbi:MAG: aminoglycoside phosphotransferase family protein [Alphaproteobacteria bacterium]|nr:aminoglycoside phosphotransferase family protein [Alphaproteobacteria bacterium]
MDDGAFLHAALARLGLRGDSGSLRFEKLAGGVSSDIWRVDLPSGPVCIKRALPKLRVETDWFVPVERNAYEVGWFETAAGVEPDAVPELVGHDPQAGLFAMAFLDPERYPPWKAELRAGRANAAVAAEVGRRIARIHSASAGKNAIAARFPTDRIFHAIRLEPYLEATAAHHPDLKDVLFGLSRRTAGTTLALVHGDVSPKNILIGPAGPVFIDAECAWYGDPVFDISFCLKHMFLKCLWNPEYSLAYLACFDALCDAWLAGVDWEPRDAAEARAAALLPGLFLGRVDGRSPVEYVTEERDRNRVRRVARALLISPPARLRDVGDAWRTELGL